MRREPSMNYLEDILRVLTNHQVRFVVAGGVAAVLHGVERTTMDLDIALDMSDENIVRFRDAVTELGLQPLVPVAVEALADRDAVRMMVEEKNAIVFMLADPEFSLRKVDVFLTPELSFETLASDAIDVELPDIQLKVISIQRLLDLKRAIDPARDKDLFDIRALERIISEGNGDE